MTLPKWAYNILGNFGVGVTAPFVGNNIGVVLFDGNYTLEQIIIISFAGGAFNLILSGTKEALERGRKNWK